jgi:dihydrodipicolinate synthase/N-acetylneuraminate lyase
MQNGYGADMLFGVGTTGEWNRIANTERQRVMEIEIDEVRRFNGEQNASLPPSALRTPHSKVEAWVGVNGATRAEILSNVDAALQLGADTAVIAPLAIEDLAERDIVRFFQRDLTDLLESARRALPIFLYDNADINAPGRTPHIRTHIVKELSRLPWLRGIKVSAPRRVLGNYTKAALHYKQPGEFGIYIGNAMLIFDWYRQSKGRLRAGWHEYLLSHTLPIGVVAGPGNVFPREWQKAWRVAWAGDEELTDLYQSLCAEFENICEFTEGGRPVNKMIACLKYALELDGVLTTSVVGRGTKALTDEQRALFGERYRALQERLRRQTAPRWQSTLEPAMLPATR